MKDKIIFVPPPKKVRQPTVKQKLWALAMADTNGNAAQAARKAGYSKKVAKQIGHRNRRNELVQEFIHERIEDAIEKAGSSYEWKVRKLRIVAEVCAPDNATTKQDVAASGTVAAIAELNKMEGDLAAIKTKTEVNFVDTAEGKEVQAQIDKLKAQLDAKFRQEA